MILEMDKVRGYVKIPLYNIKWNEIFYSQLCNRNEQFRKNNPAPNRKLSKGDAFIHNLTKKSHKYKNSAPIVKTPNDTYSDYSNFVPLRNKCIIDKNQCERDIPFLTYCYRKQYELEQQKLQEQIQQNIVNVRMFRQNISSRYNPFMSFIDRVDMYVQLLSYGTKIFQHFENLHSLIYQLTRISGIFQQKIKIKRNISITIDKESQINPQTISLTMKSLYCPLCLIYDCTIHNEHNLRAGTLSNCQYVSPKNKKNRMEHLKSSLQMLSYDGQQNQQEQKCPCSKQCYKNMAQLKKISNKKMMMIIKQTTMSDLTKSLISIGVQLFSFIPCQIKILLPENQLTCSQIQTYLQNQYNIRSRIFNKLYINQCQMLINQGTKQQTQLPKQILAHQKKKRNKMTNKFKSKNSKDGVKRQKSNSNAQAISICMHHFLNQSSYDENCENCICNDRGYCLPSCLCSDRCTIMKVGCHCKKGKKICNTNSCICYENGVQCVPQLCGKNCSGSQNCCSNQQIQMRKFKKVKISNSKIPQAGLGLFAGEAIAKDSLVTVYLGEKVNQFIISLRDKLRKNNTFYNFQCNGVHLDSRFMGNKSRFINHSTSKLENLKVRIVKSGGQKWIAFYAYKDIEEGEQLYFDYDGDGELATHHAEKYPFIHPK